MSRKCVRVNPQRLLQGNKSASSLTVTLPLTHEVFSTKNWVLMEPLNVPLRENRVGTDECREDTSFKVDPDLPNVHCVTYYATRAVMS